MNIERKKAKNRNKDKREKIVEESVVPRRCWPNTTDVTEQGETRAHV